MKVNNVSFGKWYAIPYRELKRLSPEEALKFGLTIANQKSKQPTCSELTAFCIDIASKKEAEFLKSCDTYGVKAFITY